jgi:UDP-N-acetylmuramoyl-L-alanyl-D-glutamate--2,6-diaminopimelate ligase
MKTTDFIKLISSHIEKMGLIGPSEELSRMTADSKEADEGTVFFCIKGSKVDGHDFAEQVIRNNAALVIGEKDLNIEKYIQVRSVKDVLKLISPVFYNYPDSRMKMAAVTGTNGKTSTTFMIESMLSGIFRCGVIGTLGYRYGGRTFDAPNTTPLNWKWYSLLNEMEKVSTEVVISEVSSHAIEEERIEKTLFDVAVFTNLTRDHLDFHGDIENYFQAKKKLFTKHLKKGGKAVINYDDIFGKRLYEEICDSVECIRISESYPDAEIKILIKKLDSSGSTVDISFEGVCKTVKIPLLGKYNIYNTVCAFAVCSVLAGRDMAFESAGKRVSVPGRLEQIGKESIFVDYAHSPDALENILKTVIDLKIFKRIITVIGAGGDRDRGKRPLMGEVATRYSDIVILTDDNPRSEDPEDIIRDILAGCNPENSVIEVINNRSEAIRRAVFIKTKEDALIVAGKGAENYQITHEGKRFFSDREEIEKYLRELQNVHNSTD